MKSYKRAIPMAVFALSIMVAALYSGDLPLWKAAKEGNIEIVKARLAKGDDPNRGDHCTPLVGAAISGSSEITRLLLEKGADPNLPDKDKTLPLGTAALGTNVEIVQMLLEHKANPNLVYAHNWLPLSAAARNDRIDVAKVLLAHGARPDFSEFPKHSRLIYLGGEEVDRLLTPLAVASQYGRSEIIAELLKAGVNPDFLADKDQLTALMYATQSGSVEAVKELLKAGAKPDLMVQKNQYTALAYASLYGYSSIVEELLNAGANPTVRSGEKYVQSLPICFAARAGSSSAIRTLIQHGVSVNEQCDLGGCHIRPEENTYTPLMLAAKYGKPDAVMTLLELGADYTASRKGKTALDMAYASNAVTDILSVVNKEGSKNLKSSTIDESKPYWRYHDIDIWLKMPQREVTEIGKSQLEQSAFWRRAILHFKASQETQACLAYTNVFNEYADSLIELIYQKIGPQAETAGAQAVYINVANKNVTYKTSFLGQVLGAAMAGAISGAIQGAASVPLQNQGNLFTPPSGSGTVTMFELNYSFLTYKR